MAGKWVVMGQGSGPLETRNGETWVSALPVQLGSQVVGSIR